MQFMYADPKERTYYYLNKVMCEYTKIISKYVMYKFRKNFFLLVF